MKWGTKISDGIYNIEKIISILLAGVLLTILIAGVIWRYFFKAPIFWADELALFCLVWITFIGGSMGIKEKLSPAITILTDSLKGRLKQMVTALSVGCALVFTIYITYVAIVWIQSPNIAVQVSTALKWPKFYSYLCIPISFTFMSIHLIALLMETLQKKPTAKEVTI